ncbi:restriction endonuclease subunit S [Aeromonas veronii]
MSKLERQPLVGKYRNYSTYSNSGVDWIGEMPAVWTLKRVKHMFTIRKRIAGELGYDILSVTQRGIVVKDIESGEGQLSMDYSKYQRVKPGDFAMNHMDLLTGYVDISDYDGVTSPDYRVFTLDNTDYFAKYFLYIFQMGYQLRLFFHMGQGASHLGRWRLATDEFNEMVFPVPSCEEQRTIAAFLDYETARIDRLIAQQQRLIELLKEKRQAVISHAVTKGLNPDVPMKDSGVEWLGQVPEHWVVGPIKYTLQSKKGACKAGPFGSHLTNADMTGSDVKVITQRNVIDDDMEVGDSYISSDKYKELRAFTIQKGDILVTTRGTIGRTALFQQEYTAILHPCLIRLQADGAILLPEWLSLLIQESGYVVEQILIKSNATTIEVIYSESLLNVDIAYPPSESEQIDVLDFINCQKMKFQHLISAAGRAISLMQERRTALISAAVTGKIDLRGWTPPADEVAA